MSNLEKRIDARAYSWASNDHTYSSDSVVAFKAGAKEFHAIGIREGFEKAIEYIVGTGWTEWETPLRMEGRRLGILPEGEG